MMGIVAAEGHRVLQDPLLSLQVQVLLLQDPLLSLHDPLLSLQDPLLLALQDPLLSLQDPLLSTGRLKDRVTPDSKLHCLVASGNFVNRMTDKPIPISKPRLLITR
jgi:hypothetical protein